MRYCLAMIMIMAIASPSLAQEVYLGLDHCLVLNDDSGKPAEGKLAIKFSIPDSLLGKDVVYAELYLPISLGELAPDSSAYELNVHRLLSNWSPDDLTYMRVDSLADSMNLASYILISGDTTGFHLDITSFISSVLSNSKDNFGLVAYGDLLGEGDLELPEDIGILFEHTARIRVVYK